jgi:hypothetical protein
MSQKGWKHLVQLVTPLHFIAAANAAVGYSLPLDFQGGMFSFLFAKTKCLKVVFCIGFKVLTKD